MLALHPSPPQNRHLDILACRGRSRQVSDTALARQASQERRLSCATFDAIQRTFFACTERSQSSTAIHNHSSMPPIVQPVPVKATLPPSFIRSASPSPPSSGSMSPDHYDSPPSPPRSLEDQVHIAYALEDIHGAKILLLRLQGIEVTSDDDPRIAAIQDDDFDRFFLPNGGLMMDERDEKAMLEMQACEMARIEERRRMDRLRNCEKKWETGKRRMREERLVVLRRQEKKRQEEEEQRRRTEEHRRRLSTEEERRRLQREKSERSVQRSAGRKVVSYDYLQPCQSPPQRPQFVYDFPSSTCRTPSINRQPVPQPPPFDDSAAIPFTVVLASMQGPLFPDDSIPSPSRTYSRPKDARLLEALLVHVEQDAEEHRRRKGKFRAQVRREHGPCPACSAISPPSSPLPSTSAVPIPRPSSWLSFRSISSSASSSTTDLSTPSTTPPLSSPKSGWFPSRPKSWIPDPVLSSSPHLRHSCRQHTRLVPVPLVDGPLTFDTPQPTPRPASVSSCTVPAAKEGAGVLVRRMSKIVELAKGFQSAYVSAALFSVSASHDNFDDRGFSTFRDPSGEDTTKSVRDSQEASKPRCSNDSNIPKLRPAGYRVSASDVAYFLVPTLPVGSHDETASTDANPLPPKYIPLTSPYPPTDTPHTILPDHLPYRLVFKPVPSPSRSPFRFHALSELHTMYPSADPLPSAMAAGKVSWRLRSVGNPVHMRLKALHNMVRRYGMQWEGAARETALGGGRERVLGVAYEGVGSSMLRRTASSPS